MAVVEFEDYTIQVMGMLDDNIFAALEEAAGEVVSQVKRNTRVDTAQTKNSWQHKVTGSFLAGEFRAHIGSDDENTIWEEFGTGEHALEGNGRKGAWYVPVEKVAGKKKPTYNGKVIIVHGKNGQEFYKTNGKKPSRAFWNAYISLKDKIIKRLESALRGV